jgi:hypothetical protein
MFAQAYWLEAYPVELALLFTVVVLIDQDTALPNNLFAIKSTTPLI